MTDTVKKMWSEEEMEAAITRVLEERREVAVPESFAARVCGSLPEKPVVRRRVGAAASIAMVMVVVALGAVFALAAVAPKTFGSVAFDVECLLILQLAAIMCWLAVRRES